MSAQFSGQAQFPGSVVIPGTLTLSAMTPGSVLFAGAGGLLSQDNANLFWDNTNKRLGIGTAAAPAQALDVKPSAGGPAIFRDAGGSGLLTISAFTATIAATLAANGFLQANANIGTPSTTAQAITAVGNTISPTRFLWLIDPDANYTLTSTPTIAVAGRSAGDLLLVRNVDAGAFAVTLQDESALPGAKLRLQAAGVALGPNDSLLFVFDGNFWCQISLGNVL